MPPQVHDDPELLTDAGLAEFLRISTRTIVRRLKDPDFPRPVHIGKCRRWRKAAITEYLSAKESEAGR